MAWNLNSQTLLVEMQNGIAIWKTVWQFVIKLNIYLLYDSKIPLLLIYKREAKHDDTKILLCMLLPS